MKPVANTGKGGQENKGKKQKGVQRKAYMHDPPRQKKKNSRVVRVTQPEVRDNRSVSNVSHRIKKQAAKKIVVVEPTMQKKERKSGRRIN